MIYNRDVAHCTGAIYPDSDCPLAEKCYRHWLYEQWSSNDELQCYAAWCLMPAYNRETNECETFVNLDLL